MNRHPPFGNQISEAVSKVPSYTITVEQVYNYNQCYVLQFVWKFYRFSCSLILFSLSLHLPLPFSSLPPSPSPLFSSLPSLRLPSLSSPSPSPSLFPLTQTSNLKPQHCDLSITIHLTNHTLLKEIGNTFGANHSSLLLVGDANDRVLCRQRISDSQLMGCGQYTRKLSLQRARAGDELRIHFVSLDKVGSDMEEKFTPRYSTPPISDTIRRQPQVCA